MKTNAGKQSIEHDGPRLTNAPGGRARLKSGYLPVGRAAFWIALFWVGFVAHSFAAYNFTTIDHPADATTTEVLGIDGTSTVGFYVDLNGNTHGFLHTSATNEQLDEVSGTTVAATTEATGISGGTIAGDYVDLSGSMHGFTLSGTTYSSFDEPNASTGTYVTGISAGTVVGYYVDSSGSDNGFLLSGTTYTTLDDPEAGLGVTDDDFNTGTFTTGISGGTVVGYYVDDNGYDHGYSLALSSTTYTDLDDPNESLGTTDNNGITGTIPLGVSGNTIVGYYVDANGDDDGFMLSGTTYTDLDDPYDSNADGNVSGYGSYATGISGNNIVGYYTGGNTTYLNGYATEYYGFDYNDAGGAFTTYSFPLPAGQAPYVGQTTYVEGVFDGNIVGYYTDEYYGYYAYYGYYDYYSVTHGFSYNGSTYTQLDVNTTGSNATTAQYTYATGASLGNIVGYYVDQNYEEHGFSFNGSAYTSSDDPLAAGNESPYGTMPSGTTGSETVGSFYDNNVNVYFGFSLTGTTYTTLFNPFAYSQYGLVNSYATGISGASIVGYALSGDHNIGYLYDGTKYTAVSDPLATGTDNNGDSGTAAYGISGKEIVGLYVGSDSIDHGFLDDNGKFTTIDDPLATGGYTQAVGISGSSIVGNYLDSGFNNHGFLATALPTTAIAMDTDVGSYTALLNGGSTAATGYATLVIKKNGTVTVAGKLPDGQSFTAGGDLIKDGTTPEFMVDAVLNYPKTKYYNQKGFLLGTLTFEAVTGSSQLITTSGTTNVSGTISNFTGTLEWSTPPQSLDGFGITTLSVLGSAYSNAGTPLPGPGTVILSDYGALSVSGTTAFDPAGSIDSVSDDLAVTSAQNKLTLKLNKSTGLYQGTFVYPGETKPTSYSGVLFKDVDNTGSYLINGGGLFLGPNGLGSVEIISQ